MPDHERDDHVGDDERDGLGPTRGPDDAGSADADDPVEAPPHTGDPAVDEALSRVAGCAELPPEDQVVTFDAVHRVLQDRLADIDG